MSDDVSTPSTAPNPAPLGDANADALIPDRPGGALGLTSRISALAYAIAIVALGCAPVALVLSGVMGALSGVIGADPEATEALGGLGDLSGAASGLFAATLVLVVVAALGAVVVGAVERGGPAGGARAITRVLAGSRFALLTWLAMLVGIIGAAIGATVAILVTGADNPNQGWMMVGLLAGLFPLLALMGVFYTKVVAKRPLSSMGFCGPNWWSRYARGWGIGVVLALALTAFGSLIAALVGVETPAFDGEPHARLIATPGFWMLVAGIIVIMSIQGGSEEVLVRGWMMSAVARQAGFAAALWASSLMFGLLHADRMVIGLGVGLMSLAALSSVGLLLGVWAAREQSIGGVCGAHGGFNATLVLFGLFGIAVTSDADTVGEMVTTFLADITAMPEASDAWPLILAQLILFSVVAAWAARGLPKRGAE